MAPGGAIQGLRRWLKKQVDMRKRCGLTLGEILLAMAVALMAVVALASLVVTIHRASVEGKQQAAASMLARQELELLRGDQSELKRIEALGVAELTSHSLQVDDRLLQFQCSVSARPEGALSGRYLNTVVFVRWEQNGRQREVRLVTYLPKP